VTVGEKSPVVRDKRAAGRKGEAWWGLVSVTESSLLSIALGSSLFGNDFRKRNALPDSVGNSD
jgi:hypothetical protein